MNDCNFNEEKIKKLKKIWNDNPPYIVDKILFGILFLGLCPAGLIWVWSIIPYISKVFNPVLLQSIFWFVVVIYCVFGVIPYLHQFFFYNVFPGRFMGLKGPWWDRATKNYDLKHDLVAKHAQRKKGKWGSEK